MLLVNIPKATCILLYSSKVGRESFCHTRKKAKKVMREREIPF